MDRKIAMIFFFVVLASYGMAQVLEPAKKPYPFTLTDTGTEFIIGNKGFKIEPYIHDSLAGESTSLKIANTENYQNEFIPQDNAIKWNIKINRDLSDVWDEVQLKINGFTYNGTTVQGSEYNVDFSDAVAQGFSLKFSQPIDNIILVNIGNLGYGNITIDPLISPNNFGSLIEGIDYYAPAIAYITPQIVLSCYVDSTRAVKLARSTDAGVTWTTANLDLNKGYSVQGSRMCGLNVNADNNVVVAYFNNWTAGITQLFVTQGDYDSDITSAGTWQIPYMWVSDSTNSYISCDINSTGQLACGYARGSGQRITSLAFFNSDLNVANGFYLDTNVANQGAEDTENYSGKISVSFVDKNVMVAWPFYFSTKVAAYSFVTNASSGDVNVGVGCSTASDCVSPTILQTTDGNIFVSMIRDWGTTISTFDLYKCTGGSYACTQSGASYSQDANVFGSANARYSLASMSYNTDNWLYLFYSPWNAGTTNRMGYLYSIYRFDTNALFSPVRIIDTNLTTGAGPHFSCNKRNNWGASWFSLGCSFMDANVTTGFLSFDTVINNEPLTPPTPPSGVTTDFTFTPAIPYLDTENGITTVAVNFNDISVSLDGGDVNSWKWFVNGSQFSTDQNTSRTFTSVGDYNISLISGDTNGFFGQKDQNVTIYLLPHGPAINYQVLDFNSSSTAVRFTGSVTGGTVSFYHWGFNNDGNVFGNPVEKTFTDFDNITTCLIVGSPADVNKMTCIETFNTCFTMTNEVTGAEFDVSQLQGLTVRSYDSNLTLDLKNPLTSSFCYFGNTDTTVRLDFNYSGGIDIFKEFNYGVLNQVTDVNVCAAPPGLTISEQLIISSIPKSVTVKPSIFGCYASADFTKYAYQNALSSKVYTISAPYTLYVVNEDGNRTALSLIEGSATNTINLDVIEFYQQQYDFQVAQQGIAVERINDTNTFVVYYSNQANDNVSVIMNIYDGNDLEWTYVDSNSPNNFTVFFDFTGKTLDANLLQIEIIRTFEDGTTKAFSQYFTLQGKSALQPTQLLNPYVGLIMGFMLFFAFFSLVGYRLIFSWFGLIVELIVLFLLAISEPTWFTLLGQAMIVIIMVYTGLVMKDETAGAVT